VKKTVSEEKATSKFTPTQKKIYILTKRMHEFHNDTSILRELVKDLNTCLNQLDEETSSNEDNSRMIIKTDQDKQRESREDTKELYYKKLIQERLQDVNVEMSLDNIHITLYNDNTDEFLVRISSDIMTNQLWNMVR
jgi:hypothetical protein